MRGRCNCRLCGRKKIARAPQRFYLFAPSLRIGGLNLQSVIEAMYGPRVVPAFYQDLTKG
ncbi:hypothetical protein Mro03_11510 [Microbispora rosea subsp. rosea]|nr:hypothetical protein Mro03_11510 [Microbispora rosea subsp. rosea]